MLALDAAVNSIVKPKDKVLVLATGIFGHGFSDMIINCNAEPIVVATKDYNEILNEEKVKEAIDAHPDITAITMVHCETPRGTLNPLKQIAKICHKTNAVLIVDAVSSNGGTEVQTDNWGIDINLGASQKCFSSPPGISFLSLSKKALERIDERKTIPTFYSNLKIWTDSWIKNRELPYTHSITNLYGFRESIEMILEEGLKNVYRRHKNISQAIVNALEAIGLELYPKVKASISPTVTAFKAPESINAENLRSLLWRKYGVLIAGAWGPILGKKILRLGNMGYRANLHYASIALNTLEKGLFDLGYKVKVGTAIGTFLNQI